MLCLSPALLAPRSLVEGASFIEGVEGAGIQMPSFTGEVILAQIRKRALDIGPYVSFPAF